MLDQPPAQTHVWPMHWIILVYLLLLGLNVWFFWFLPEVSAIAKVSFLLSIVGVYSLTLNFSSATGLAKTSSDGLDNLTSPNLRYFASGTFRVVAVVALLASLSIRGFPPPAPRWIRFLLIVLAIPMLASMLVAAIALILAYLVVIAPVAYVGYLLTAAFLSSVENAPSDFALSSGGYWVDLKEIVRAHRVQLRTLVVGVPATVVGVGTTAYSLFA